MGRGEISMEIEVAGIRDRVAQQVDITNFLTRSRLQRYNYA